MSALPWSLYFVVLGCAVASALLWLTLDSRIAGGVTGVLMWLLAAAARAWGADQ